MKKELKNMTFPRLNIHLSIEISKIRIGHGISIKVLKKIASQILYLKLKIIKQLTD